MASDVPAGKCGVGIDDTGTWPEFQCSLLQGADAPKFQLSTGQNSGASNPCTNIPVRCPAPNCLDVVWSYSLAKHYAVRHSGEAVPNAVTAAGTRRFHEEAYLQRDRLPGKSKAGVSLCIVSARGGGDCKAFDAQLKKRAEPIVGKGKTRGGKKK